MRWRDLDDPKAFSAYMESLDKRLREQGVPIDGRPLSAMALVSGELKISFTLRSDVANRIHGWFEARYGERLNMDATLGRMLVLVGGEPYVARFPVVYGTVKVSLLQVIEGITQDALGALPPAGIQSLVTLMKNGFDAFITLAGLQQEVLADRHTAVTLVMARPASPALSKWASQQMVEKMLNAFVQRKAGDLKRARKGSSHAHDLAPLVAEAQRCGLTGPDPDHIKQVECTADVRYPERAESSAVTVVQAVEANQAAVFICASVAKQW